MSLITLLLDKQLILSSLMSMSLPVFGRFDFFSIFAGTARISPRISLTQDAKSEGLLVITPNLTYTKHI